MAVVFGERHGKVVAPCHWEEASLGGLPQKKIEISGFEKCILVDPIYGFVMDNGESTLIYYSFFVLTFPELRFYP